MKYLRVAILLAGTIPAASSRPPAPETPAWGLAHNAHFEVYAQTGVDDARKMLAWFEELRTFFAQNGVLDSVAQTGTEPAIRVLGFRDQKEYLAFQLSPSADAYYIGYDRQNYIVLPGTAPAQYSMAAHEYAHFVLHASGWKLPFWLSEGIAEFFSTARRSGSAWEFGGPLPSRLATLRKHPMLPLSELFSFERGASILTTREGSAMFYAESWAAASLLISSHEYKPHLHDLLRELSSGTPTQEALRTIYGKTLAEWDTALREWVSQNNLEPRRVEAMPIAAAAPGEARELSQFDINQVLAALLLAQGDLNRAASLYRAIAAAKPAGDVSAALGTIAMRRGDQTDALAEWSRALDQGITDPQLCYQFAVLADQKNVPETQIRHALERAVQLNPTFDDAHFRLAQIESNAREFAAALRHLDAVRLVPPSRQFAFWSMRAYAFLELDRRDDAKAAAAEARKRAASVEDRRHAEELAYLAETDIAVRFEPDAAGRMRLVEMRVPHGSAETNPFIEPGDRITRTAGTLREVQCGDGKLTGFSLAVNGRALQVAVPDPQRVQMRNSPSQFTCGAQIPQTVAVEYNSDGVLRGMEFR